MPDELAVAVATALVSKGADAAISGARSALAALARLVRERIGSQTPEAATLHDAQHHPDDPARTSELVRVIERAMADDPAFAQWVQAQWRLAEAERVTGDGAVVNQMSGSADRVVQARDIHGDIRF